VVGAEAPAVPDLTGAAKALALKRAKKAAYNKEYNAKRPMVTCGIDGCTYETKDKGDFKKHQACMHGIGDSKAVEERKRRKREYYARQPTVTCDVPGCTYMTTRKDTLREHQAWVHGTGGGDVAEKMRKKQRESKARQALQMCGFGDCR
jgi:hypothetical protein